MVEKDNNIDWFLIPNINGLISENKGEDLFDNLIKITPDEIAHVWDEIYKIDMIRKLKEWCEDTNLDLDLALFLIDKWHAYLLMDNIKKFNQKNYKEIIFKIIETICWDYSDKDVSNSGLEEWFKTFANDLWDIFYCKEVAIALIDNGAGAFVIENIDKFKKLDSEVVKKLIWKWTDIGELKDLQYFTEDARKAIALMQIKSRIEPDFSQIPKVDFTQDFAEKILLLNTEEAYRILSKNISYFDESIQKTLVLKYIKGSLYNLINEKWSKTIKNNETAKCLVEKWYTEYLLNDLVNFSWLDKEIISKLKEKWIKIDAIERHLNGNFDDLLKCFKAEDRRDVALEVIKWWWNLNFSQIPEKDLTKEFSEIIMNLRTDESYEVLAENINYFDKETQKEIIIKYIEIGRWNYIDAKCPQELINCKEVAIALINNWLESELTFRFDCLDTDVLNILKENECDFKGLGKLLGCFKIEDRENAALEIIKAWWEPDLNLIPKKFLTKDFAAEILNLKLDNWLKVLSYALPFFPSSLVRDIVLGLINAGGWKYIKAEVEKTKRFDDYLDKDFIQAVLRNEGTTEAWKILKKFNNLDSEVALIFINVGEARVVVSCLESFNNLDDKVAKALIDEWYKAKVFKHKERFNLHDEKLKSLINNSHENKNKAKSKSNILKWRRHSLKGWKKDHIEKAEDSDELIKELMIFRKEWVEREDLATDDIRDIIIKAAEKINMDINIDTDWNKIFTLRLKDRTLKILSPQLWNYTDEKYKDEVMNESGFDSNRKIYKSYVKLEWMNWDDTSKWGNKKLAKYVEEQEKKGFHIPSKNEMIGILTELWETSDLEIDEDRKDIEFYGTPILTEMQMLLLMYLIGSPGFYRLRDWGSLKDHNSRFMMDISKYFACFEEKEYVKDDWFSANLLMIKIQ